MGADLTPGTLATAAYPAYPEDSGKLGSLFEGRGELRMARERYFIHSATSTLGVAGAMVMLTEPDKVRLCPERGHFESKYRQQGRRCDLTRMLVGIQSGEPGVATRLRPEIWSWMTQAMDGINARVREGRA